MSTLQIRSMEDERTSTWTPSHRTFHSSERPTFVVNTNDPSKGLQEGSRLFITFKNLYITLFN